MSEHTTTTPTDSCKPAASRRKTATKPRPKKAGAGGNGQRDAYGRFQAGNPGGFGNPYARQVAILRRELMQRTRPEEIREIGNKLLALAKAGNVQAAKVILSYTLGLPTPAPQPDRVDADELTVFNEELELQASLTAQMKNPGLEVNLRHIRARRLYNAYLAARMLDGALTATPEERKRHREETAGLPADQQALGCAELGNAKNWLPCHEQELLFKPWEPWPAEEAAPADAAPQAATTSHGANDNAAKNHAANGHAAANRLQGADRNGAAHKGAMHKGAMHNGAARAATGAPTAKASKNAAAHEVASTASAPSTNGVSEGCAATTAAAPVSPNAPDKVASPPRAPSTNGVIRARSKYALLPKSMRPKGVIVPRF
jgi:hypothetical protein